MKTRHLIAAAALAAIGAAASAAPADAYTANTSASQSYSGEAFGTVQEQAPNDAAPMVNDTAGLPARTANDPLAQAESYGAVSLADGTLGHTDGHSHQSAQFRVNDAYGAQTAMAVASTPQAGLSRAEVQAELMSARASGEFDARGETSGDLGDTKFGNLPFAYLPEQASAVAAAPVIDTTATTTTSDTLVLMVPADQEVVTLQPGEAVLLVPMDESAADE